MRKEASRPSKKPRPSKPNHVPAAAAAAPPKARGFPVGSIEPKTGLPRKVGGNHLSPVPCGNPGCGAGSVCAYSHAGKLK